MRHRSIVSAAACAVLGLSSPARATPFDVLWTDGDALLHAGVDPVTFPDPLVTDAYLDGIPSGTTWSGSRRDAFVHGTDQHIHHLWSLDAWASGSWNDWGTPIAGALLGNPEAVVADDGRHDVYVRARTGSVLSPSYGVWVASWSNSAGWRGWRSLGRPGTTALSNVAAAAMSPSVLTVYVASGGRLYEAYSLDGGATYASSWIDLGRPADAPALVGDPDAASLDASSVDLVIAAGDGSIRRWSWRAQTGGVWTTMPAPPAGVTLQNPSIVARADHSLAVVALSTTLRIYEWTEAAPWWTPGAGGLVGATGLEAVARP